jgi:membrane protein
VTDAKPTSRIAQIQVWGLAQLQVVRSRWPFLDHALRAQQHYNDVFGRQLAAAITYFGFLSFFPLLALAFALVGYVSARFPDAQATVTDALEQAFPGLIGPGPSQLNVQDIIDAKAGASLIGLVGLFYAGLGLIDALRDALRRVFGTADKRLTYIKKKSVDAVVLVGLGLALLTSLVVTSLATEVTTQTLGLVGLEDSLVAILLLKVLSVALALLADALLLAILLSRLSGAHQTWRELRVAAILGAVGFEVLKLAGTFIIGRITSNPLYAAFGFVVGLLIWINLVSRLVIVAAAWAATPPHPEPSTKERAASAAAPVVVVRGHEWRFALLGAAIGAAVVALFGRRKDAD